MSNSQISFCFDIQDLSRLESKFSPTVFLRGVPWRINVKKVFVESVESLGVYLECGRKGTNTNWSHVASIYMKMLNDKGKAIDCQTEPFVFDEQHSFFGESNFIDFHYLLDVKNGYVKKNAFDLYITIEMNDPSNIDRSVLLLEDDTRICSSECIAKKLTVTNVQHLMAVKSQEFEMNGRRGILVVYKHQDHLGVGLIMIIKGDSFQRDKLLFVKLVSTKGHGFSLARLYETGRTENFLSWNELLKPENGFINDNSIKIEVSLLTTNTFLHTKGILHALTSRISVPEFRIEVQNVSKLTLFLSPEVTIRGIPWGVQVTKKIVNGKLSLIVYLYCVGTSTPLEANYIAACSIKLISFNENVEAVECHNVPVAFDNFKTAYGDPVIEWDELFDASKCYVKNDSIKLNIKIDVADPNDSEKSTMIFKNISNNWKEDYRKFSVTIRNVRSLLAVISPKFTIEQQPWSLAVYKHEGHLGVVLYYFGDESCAQTMIVKLLSQKESVEQIQTKCLAPFEDLYAKGLISWDELFKPESLFVLNNSITLEVTIAANVEDARGCHEPSAPELHLEPEREERKMDCTICLENMKEKGVSSIPCGHLFCSPCIKEILKTSFMCPLCRSPASLNDVRRIYLPF